MRTFKWFVIGGGLLNALLLAVALTPDARSSPPPYDKYYPRPWLGMRVSLDVLVHGQVVRQIHHQGKTYLPVASWGTRYELRVWNHGSRRITAIASVDGLSVMNSEPASEDHPGYVVYPRGNVVIKGWRKDDNTVAAFEFVEREQSYAAKLGHSENVGVIGLVAFEEMGRKWPVPVPMERNTGKASDVAKAHSAVGGTGTGEGPDVYSPVIEVPFVRSNNKRTITIYYDTADALRQAGIPVTPTWPDPFPGDR